MKKIKYLGGLFIGLLLLTGVTACGSNSKVNEPASTLEVDEKDKSGGTLKVAFSAEPDSIDWMYTGATATRDVGWHIFETLFALDRDYQVQPMIAEDYEISDDQKLYTIHIREDVTFHDGSELTVEDVAASIDRWQLVSAVGSNASNYIDEVTITDPNTIEITLNQVYNSLLADFAAPKQALVILPKEIAEEAGESPLTVDQLVGTGPYLLKNWDRGKEIILTKYDGYSARSEDTGGLSGKKTAYIDEIKFIIVKDPQVMVNGLKTGIYDYIQSISPDLYEVVNSEPNIEPITYINGYMALTPNKVNEPLSDVKVREAINLALDNETIAKSVYGNEDFYALDGALFDPDQQTLYVEEGTENFGAYDPEEAKRIIADSKYDGKPLKIMYANNFERYEKSAEVIKQQLEEVGLNIELVSYEWATYLEKWQDPDNWDFVVVGWSTRFSPNELGMLSLDTASSGFYESKRWEDLLRQWSNYGTEEEKDAILADMNETVWNELPFIKIANESVLDFRHDKIADYESWIGQRFWNTFINE